MQRFTKLLRNVRHNSATFCCVHYVYQWQVTIKDNFTRPIHKHRCINALWIAWIRPGKPEHTNDVPKYLKYGHNALSDEVLLFCEAVHNRANITSYW